MSKQSSSTSSRRRISPLLIIGGSVIVLAAAFYFIAGAILENRDPEVSRTLAEREADNGRPAESGQPGGAGGDAWREDALLTFIASDGTQRATIRVEIAENEDDRTQGLMGRQTMAEDQGMLFIFPNEEYRSFWMANTPLPLDILFLDRDREIVTIQRNTVPYSEESVPSTGPAMYVVEVNAGYADRHALTEGDRVQWTRK